MSSLDPLAGLLPVNHPPEFDLLPEDERRWRLRLYLATWAMGAPENLSWAAALNDDPVHVAESFAVLGGIEDDALRAAVVDRMDAQASHRPAMGGGAAATPSPGELLWDHLLVGSRTRSKSPSRVTILVMDKTQRERG